MIVDVGIWFAITWQRGNKWSLFVTRDKAWNVASSQLIKFVVVECWLLVRQRYRNRSFCSLTIILGSRQDRGWFTGQLLLGVKGDFTDMECCEKVGRRKAWTPHFLYICSRVPKSGFSSMSPEPSARNSAESANADRTRNAWPTPLVCVASNKNIHKPAPFLKTWAKASAGQNVLSQNVRVKRFRSEHPWRKRPSFTW